jgi:capsid assembly protease
MRRNQRTITLRRKIMTKFLTMPSLWAILPEQISILQHAYVSYLSGDEISAFKIAQPHAEVPVAGIFDVDLDKIPPSTFMNGDIGVLPVEGVITPKADFWTRLFGGATLDVLTRDFNALVNDDSVKAIVLDIDSPGGVAFGVEQFANLVFEAREVKPIYAITSTMMASAATWIGAAAKKIYITGEVVMTGSIGTVISHIDISEMEKKHGIKTTEITAGKFKRISSNFKPLSDEGREELQSQVDHVNSAFVSDIARFRGVDVDTVNSDMADGKTFLGSLGVKAGLVDGIVTAEDFIDIINADTNNSANIDRNLQGDNSMGTLAAKDKSVVAGIDAKQLEESNPALYNEVFSAGADAGTKKIKLAKEEGVAEGKIEGIEEGKLIGATDERNRIMDVEAQSMPGHENLIDALKKDGNTTGPQAAVKVVNAEKVKMSGGLKSLADGSPQPIDNSIEETPAPESTKSNQEKWDADEKLRAEFDNDFGAFESYEKSVVSGQVKVLGGK